MEVTSQVTLVTVNYDKLPDNMTKVTEVANLKVLHQTRLAERVQTFDHRQRVDQIALNK